MKIRNDRLRGLSYTELGRKCNIDRGKKEQSEEKATVRFKTMPGL